MSQTRKETQAERDDVVTSEAAGLVQVGWPTVARTPDRIDHGAGLLRAAIGGLRR